MPRFALTGGGRSALSYLSIVLLLILAAALTFSLSQTIQSHFDQTVNVDAALSTTIGQQEQRIDDQESALREFLLTRHAADRQAFIRAGSSVPGLQRQARAQAAGHSVRVRLLRTLIARQRAWERWATRVADHPPHEADTPAFVPTLNTGTRLHKSIDLAMNAVLRRNAWRQRQHLQATHTAIASLRWILISILLGAISLVALFALVERRSITLPLLRLTRATERIGGGDLTRPVAQGGFGELRELHVAVERMRASLLAVEEERREAERTQTLLGAIVTSSDDAILSTTLDGTITSWNPGAERLYGFTAEEMIGRSVALLAPDDREGEVENHLQRISTGERVEHYETVRLTADGRRLDVSLSVSPIRDNSGAVVGDSSIARNITEQRRAAEELAQALERAEEAEREYRILAEQIPALIYRTPDDDSGTMTYLSPHARTLLGYAPEELVNHPGAQELFVHPGDLSWVRASDVEATQDGGPDAIEYRIITADGMVKWVRDDTSLIRDEQGRPLYWQGVVLDITEQKQAEQALRESETSFRLLFADNPLPMWVYDTETLAFLEVNDAAVRQYGYSREEFLGMRVTDIRPEEDRPHLLAKLRRERQEFEDDIWRHRRRDGITLDVAVTSHTLIYRGQSAVLVLAQDVTAQRQAEAALRQREEQYRTVVEASMDGIIVQSIDGVITFANWQAATLLGYDAPDELLARPVLDMIAPGDRDRATRENRKLIVQGRYGNGEFTLLRKDGTTFPAEVAGSSARHHAGASRSLTGVFRDITERKRAEEQLRHQALHDPLTDLPNRTLLADRLDQAIRRAERRQRPLALLLLDLNRFKLVNDTFGHAHGDRLLQTIGERLQKITRRSDTVARLGGDEFALLLEGTPLEAAVQMATTLARVLEEPCVIEEHAVYVEGSLGIALYPGHGEDGRSLLQHADVAMYLAKEHGTLFEVYEATRDPHTAETLTLIGDLRRAIGGDQLLLHYQPKLDLHTGNVRGVEALVRWRHPRRGWVPPSEFIPLAESSGLINSLTMWVVNAAFAQCASWHHEGHVLDVAINLSSRDLNESTLVETIVRAADNWRIAPSRITLEITETSLMLRPTVALDVVTRLHDRGFRIAIDDFGTGYSSLAYLQRLPVDELKVDREFVRNMIGTEAGSGAIVRSVIDLSHTLGLRVVAEGVETQPQLDQLASWNCDVVQGYLVSKPLSAEELAARLPFRQAHYGETLPEVRS